MKAAVFLNGMIQMLGLTGDMEVMFEVENEDGTKSQHRVESVSFSSKGEEIIIIKAGKP